MGVRIDELIRQIGLSAAADAGPRTRRRVRYMLQPSFDIQAAIGPSVGFGLAEAVSTMTTSAFHGASTGINGFNEVSGVNTLPLRHAIDLPTQLAALPRPIVAQVIGDVGEVNASHATRSLLGDGITKAALDVCADRHLASEIFGVADSGRRSQFDLTVGLESTSASLHLLDDPIAAYEVSPTVPLASLAHDLGSWIRDTVGSGFLADDLGSIAVSELISNIAHEALGSWGFSRTRAADLDVLEQPDADPGLRLGALYRMSNRIPWVVRSPEVKRALSRRAAADGTTVTAVKGEELCSAILLVLGTTERPQFHRFGRQWLKDANGRRIAVAPDDLESERFWAWFRAEVIEAAESAVLERPYPAVVTTDVWDRRGRGGGWPERFPLDSEEDDSLDPLWQAARAVRGPNSRIRLRRSELLRRRGR